MLGLVVNVALGILCNVILRHKCKYMSRLFVVTVVDTVAFVVPCSLLQRSPSWDRRLIVKSIEVCSSKAKIVCR